MGLVVSCGAVVSIDPQALKQYIDDPGRTTRNACIPIDDRVPENYMQLWRELRAFDKDSRNKYLANDLNSQFVEIGKIMSWRRLKNAELRELIVLVVVGSGFKLQGLTANGRTPHVSSRPCTNFKVQVLLKMSIPQHLHKRR